MARIVDNIVLGVGPSTEGFWQKTKAGLAKGNKPDVKIEVNPNLKRADAELAVWRKRQEANALNIPVKVDEQNARSSIRRVESIFKASDLSKAIRVNVAVVGAAALPALAQGALSATAALTELGQSALVLPGIFSGLAATVGTLLTGISGLGPAFSAASSGMDKGTQNARAYEKASRDLEKAQRDVVDALKDANRQLEDQHDKLARGSLGVEQASLNVTKANEALRKGGFKTYTDYRQAVLDAKDANLDLADAVKTNNRGVQDFYQNAGKSATQTDGFKDALDRLNNSVDAYGKAQSAAAGFSDQFLNAMAKLSPAGREFVNQILAIKGAWQQLQAVVQTKLLDGLGDSITDLATRRLPLLQQGMERVAGSLNTTFKSMLANLGSDKNANAISRIFANTGAAITAAAPGLNSFVNGFLKLSEVGSRFLPRLAHAFDDVAGRFEAFIDKAANDGSLEKWIDRGLRVLDSLGNSILYIGSILDSVTTAYETATGNVGGFASTAEKGLGKLAAYLQSPKGQNTLVGYLKEAQDFLDEIRKHLPGMIDAFQTLAESLRAFSEIVFPVFSFLGSELQKHLTLAKALIVAYLGFRTLKPVLNQLEKLWGRATISANKHKEKLLEVKAAQQTLADHVPLLARAQDAAAGASKRYSSAMQEVREAHVDTVIAQREYGHQLTVLDPDARKVAAAKKDLASATWREADAVLGANRAHMNYTGSLKAVSQSTALVNDATARLGNTGFKGLINRIGTGARSAAGTLTGALGGFVGLIGGVGTSLTVMWAIDQWAQANDRAADRVNAHAQAVDALQRSLDEVSGAFTAGSAKQAADDLAGGTVTGDQNKSIKVNALDQAKGLKVDPRDLISAVNPTQQKLRDSIYDKAEKDSENTISHSSEWRDWGKQLTDNGVDVKTYAKALSGDPDSIAKFNAARNKISTAAATPGQRATTALTGGDLADTVANAGKAPKSLGLVTQDLIQQGFGAGPVVGQRLHELAAGAEHPASQLTSTPATTSAYPGYQEATIGLDGSGRVILPAGTNPDSINHAADNGGATKGQATVLPDGRVQVTLDEEETRKYLQPVQKKARGGHVWGAGSATSDSIPAMLSNGEFVLNAKAAQHYGGDMLYGMNDMKMPKLAAGGWWKYNPDHPTGGGNFNPAMQIDTSTTTSSGPPLFGPSASFHDLFAGEPGKWGNNTDNPWQAPRAPGRVPFPHLAGGGWWNGWTPKVPPAIPGASSVPTIPMDVSTANPTPLLTPTSRNPWDGTPVGGNPNIPGVTNANQTGLNGIFLGTGATPFSPHLTGAPGPLGLLPALKPPPLVGPGAAPKPPVPSGTPHGTSDFQPGPGGPAATAGVPGTAFAPTHGAGGAPGPVATTAAPGQIPTYDQLGTASTVAAAVTDPNSALYIPNLSGSGALKDYGRTGAAAVQNAPINPDANIIDYLTQVGAAHGLGVGSGERAENNSQHSVNRAVDLGNAEQAQKGDISKFVQEWMADPQKVAATRQLIFRGPDGDYGIINGKVLDPEALRHVYGDLGDNSIAQHPDHVHLALEGVPLDAFGADGSGAPLGNLIPGANGLPVPSGAVAKPGVLERIKDTILGSPPAGPASGVPGDATKSKIPFSGKDLLSQIGKALLKGILGFFGISGDSFDGIIDALFGTGDDAPPDGALDPSVNPGPDQTYIQQLVDEANLAKTNGDEAQARALLGAAQQYKDGFSGASNGQAAGIGPINSSSPPADVAHYIYNTALAKGYTPEQALAITAQARGESHFSPTISGGQQGDDEVIGVFQEKSAFAGGASREQRMDPKFNVDKYFEHLAAAGGPGVPDIISTLGSVSGGGPAHPSNGGAAYLRQLMAEIKQTYGFANGGPVGLAGGGWWNRPGAASVSGTAGYGTSPMAGFNALSQGRAAYAQRGVASTPTAITDVLGRAAIGAGNSAGSAITSAVQGVQHPLQTGASLLPLINPLAATGLGAIGVGPGAGGVADAYAGAARGISHYDEFAAGNLAGAIGGLGFDAFSGDFGAASKAAKATEGFDLGAALSDDVLPAITPSVSNELGDALASLQGPAGDLTGYKNKGAAGSPTDSFTENAFKAHQEKVNGPAPVQKYKPSQTEINALSSDAYKHYLDTDDWAGAQAMDMAKHAAKPNGDLVWTDEPNPNYVGPGEPGTFSGSAIDTTDIVNPDISAIWAGQHDPQIDWHNQWLASLSEKDYLTYSHAHGDYEGNNPLEAMALGKKAVKDKQALIAANQAKKAQFQSDADLSAGVVGDANQAKATGNFYPEDWLPASILEHSAFSPEQWGAQYLDLEKKGLSHTAILGDLHTLAGEFDQFDHSKNALGIGAAGDIPPVVAEWLEHKDTADAEIEAYTKLYEAEIKAHGSTGHATAAESAHWIVTNDGVASAKFLTNSINNESAAKSFAADPFAGQAPISGGGGPTPELQAAVEDLVDQLHSNPWEGVPKLTDLPVAPPGHDPFAGVPTPIPPASNLKGYAPYVAPARPAYIARPTPFYPEGQFGGEDRLNTKAAHDALMAGGHDYHSGSGFLSPEALTAFRDGYTGPSFPNDALRAHFGLGKLSEFGGGKLKNAPGGVHDQSSLDHVAYSTGQSGREAAALMDEAIARTGGLPRSMVLHSQTAMRPILAHLGLAGGSKGSKYTEISQEDLDALIGQIFINPGYPSTAIGSGIRSGNPLSGEIHAPKGTPGIYLGGRKAATPGALSLHSEDEFLLGRDTPYMVTGHRMDPEGGQLRIIETAIMPHLVDMMRNPRPLGHAAGGHVTGPGGPTDDKIPAYLSAGEFVMRAKAVKKYGLGHLAAMNAMQIPHAADGWWVDPLQPIANAPAPGPLPLIGPGAQAPNTAPPPPGAPLIGDAGQGTPGGTPPPGAPLIGDAASAPQLAQVGDALGQAAGAALAPKSIGDGVSGFGTPTPDPGDDPRGVIGAAPANMDHNLPALSQGIQGAASTIGSLAAMALSAAGSAGGAFAPGAGAAGAAAAAGVQAGAQIAGQAVTGIANIISSLGVGTVTPAGTGKGYGAPLVPQQPAPVTNVRNDNSSIVAYNPDEAMKLRDRRQAQQAAPWLNRV